MRLTRPASSGRSAQFPSCGRVPEGRGGCGGGSTNAFSHPHFLGFSTVWVSQPPPPPRQASPAAPCICHEGSSSAILRSPGGKLKLCRQGFNPETGEFSTVRFEEYSSGTDTRRRQMTEGPQMRPFSQQLPRTARWIKYDKRLFVV